MPAAKSHPMTLLWSGVNSVASSILPRKKPSKSRHPQTASHPIAGFSSFRFTDGVLCTEQRYQTENRE